MHTGRVETRRSEVVTATIGARDVARLERLAATSGLDRSELVGRAVDGLLACDDLAGGFVGPEHGPSSQILATETITAPIRSDHLRRLDDLAARRGVPRSVLIGQAIDAFLAREALIGAFGVADTAAWFAPPTDSSIWATMRPSVSRRKAEAEAPESTRPVWSGRYRGLIGPAVGLETKEETSVSGLCWWRPVGLVSNIRTPPSC